MGIIPPDLIGDALAAASGLVGAIAGGAIGYYAARNQYKTEYRYRKWDALRPVLAEICRNQPRLQLDLDRALPYWLPRAHHSPTGDKKRIAKVVEQTCPYAAIGYDHLLADFVSSSFGSELVDYYSGIRWLNEIAHSRSFDVETEFGEYCRTLASSLLRADDLIPALHKETRKSPVRTWGKNLHMASVMESRERYLFLAHLAKYNLWQLADILEHGNEPHDFSPILARNRELLEVYVQAARAEAATISQS